MFFFLCHIELEMFFFFFILCCANLLLPNHTNRYLNIPVNNQMKILVIQARVILQIGKRQIWFPVFCFVFPIHLFAPLRCAFSSQNLLWNINYVEFHKNYGMQFDNGCLLFLDFPIPSEGKRKKILIGSLALALVLILIISGIACWKCYFGGKSSTEQGNVNQWQKP